MRYVGSEMPESLCCELWNAIQRAKPMKLYWSTNRSEISIYWSEPVYAAGSASWELEVEELLSDDFQIEVEKDRFTISAANIGHMMCSNSVEIMRC